MGKVIITEIDKNYLAESYPNLVVEESKIFGQVHFDLTYKEIRLKGKYNIDIILETKGDSVLPVVKETGGKILKIANRKKLPRSELHLNSDDGELCLIIPPKEKKRYPNGFEITEFMNHIEEHLYWVTFFDRYNKPPWKEQAHGVDGYLQLYEEDHSFRPEIKKALEKQYDRELRREEIRHLVKIKRKKK